MIFILASSMLNCTLPFVGMLPLVAYWMLTRSYDGYRWNKKLAEAMGEGYLYC